MASFKAFITAGRRKLVSNNALFWFTCIIMVVSVFWFEQKLATYIHDSQIEELESLTRIQIEIFNRHYSITNEAEFHSMQSFYKSSKNPDTRTTVIDDKGNVLVETDRHWSNIPQMDNHANRPEVAEAMEKGTGTSIRYSNTVENHLIYFAKRFEHGNLGVYVMRNAIPKKRYDSLLTGFRFQIFSVLLLLLSFYLIGHIIDKRRFNLNVARNRAYLKRMDQDCQSLYMNLQQSIDRLDIADSNFALINACKSYVTNNMPGFKLQLVIFDQSHKVPLEQLIATFEFGETLEDQTFRKLHLNEAALVSPFISERLSGARTHKCRALFYWGELLGLAILTLPASTKALVEDNLTERKTRSINSDFSPHLYNSVNTLLQKSNKQLWAFKQAQLNDNEQFKLSQQKWSQLVKINQKANPNSKHTICLIKLTYYKANEAFEQFATKQVISELYGLLRKDKELITINSQSEILFYSSDMKESDFRWLFSFMQKKLKLKCAENGYQVRLDMLVDAGFINGVGLSERLNQIEQQKSTVSKLNDDQLIMLAS